MGKSFSYRHEGRGQSSKKQGNLPGNDVPAALDEEERRPSSSKGRASCRAMERQNRHSRFGKRAQN